MTQSQKLGSTGPTFTPDMVDRVKEDARVQGLRVGFMLGCLFALVILIVLVFVLRGAQEVSAAPSAAVADVVLTDVICAEGTAPDCPTSWSNEYDSFTDIIVEVWAVHTGQWEPNEWSTFTVEGVGAVECDPLPEGAEDALCGQLQVPAGVHTFTATHRGQLSEDDRFTGSHRQWWSLQPATAPPSPTPTATATPGPSGCWPGQPGEHCSFWPVFFRQGPDWASFSDDVTPDPNLEDCVATPVWLPTPAPPSPTPYPCNVVTPVGGYTPAPGTTQWPTATPWVYP